MTRVDGSTARPAWPHARDRRPPLQVRWASRVEAWPARHWLALQFLSLLPALAGLMLRAAASSMAATGLLGTAGLVMLALVCFGGRGQRELAERPPGGRTRYAAAGGQAPWAARAPLLALAGLATGLASASAWLTATAPVAQGLATALLTFGAAACARWAFQRPGRVGEAWPPQRLRHPTRRFVQHALRQLQRAAWCKCAYGLTLATSALASACAVLQP